MLFSGVDLVEISRVEHAVMRYAHRFLARVYTPRELEQCHGRVESLAARFAAKEAAAKALGTGIWRHGIRWTDIEVVRNDAGAPRLHLHGEALHRAQSLRWTQTTVSLSHNRDNAIAFVVATADNLT